MSGASATARAIPRLANAAPGHGTAAGLRLLYSRYGALAGYTLAAALAWLGWLGRDQRNIDAGRGLGYALGITGGSLMLLLLVYSLRKRIRWLEHLGATRHWFRLHMVLGIVGPVLILYHCNFELGDLNSRVALMCTLLVAGSGVVGRYLYAGIHHGLYGRKSQLQEFAADLQQLAPGATVSALLGPIRDELVALDRCVLAPPETIGGSVALYLRLGMQTRAISRRLLREVRLELLRKALTSSVVDQHAERLGEAIARYLAEHLGRIRQVARFNAFERLFALWHVVHVPFFFMMILSAMFHVFAVHMF
ncbi:MAG: pyridine nucleotide-disulfide oxidoreductase [Gammaproteobacteria bacterium]|nr:pyridine nucleotide-disulfide oxidoreductase [Gammaproteobacteria bacterium]